MTEYMTRGTMYDVLHDPDLFFDQSVIYSWGHAITLGLQYLASANIIHGDFKSLNVLFSAQRVPKIAETCGMSSIKGRAVVD